MLLLPVWYFHFVPRDFYACMYCTQHCWGPVGHGVHAECGCHSRECIDTCYLNLLANKGKSEQTAIGRSTSARSRCFDFLSSTHKCLKNSFTHLPLYPCMSYSECCRAEYTEHKRWSAATCFSQLLLLKQMGSATREVQGKPPQAELEQCLIDAKVSDFRWWSMAFAKSTNNCPSLHHVPLPEFRLAMYSRLLRKQGICFARICKVSDPCTLGNHLPKLKIQCETLSL